MATVDNEDYLACTMFPRAGQGSDNDGYTSVTRPATPCRLMAFAVIPIHTCYGYF